MGALAKRFNLKPDTSVEVRKVHGQLKSVHEFVQDTLDALGGKEGLQDLTAALNAAAPWAGVVVNAVGDSLPSVKFLLSLFEGIGKVEDPNDLGLLAFRRAVQQAVPEVIGMAPPSNRTVKLALADLGSTRERVFQRLEVRQCDVSQLHTESGRQLAERSMAETRERSDGCPASDKRFGVWSVDGLAVFVVAIASAVACANSDPQQCAELSSSVSHSTLEASTQATPVDASFKRGRRHFDRHAGL